MNPKAFDDSGGLMKRICELLVSNFIDETVARDVSLKCKKVTFQSWKGQEANIDSPSTGSH